MPELNNNITINEKKLRSILEYCLLNGSIKNGVPKTKLLKLVYLADFSSYYFNGKSISGAIYKNRNFGPVPDVLFALIDEMKDHGDISISNGSMAQFHKLNVEPSYNENLSEEEIDLIDKICEYWRPKPTEDIVGFTHKQRPWALTRPDTEIPYQLIIQEDHPYLPVQ